MNQKNTNQLSFCFFHWEVITNMVGIGTFWIHSSAPPVTKVSFPLSSTVTAESFSKVTPAENGWPGLLQKESQKGWYTTQVCNKRYIWEVLYLSRSSYLMWMFEIESFRFPIIVSTKDPSHDLFFEVKQKQ